MDVAGVLPEYALRARKAVADDLLQRAEEHRHDANMHLASFYLLLCCKISGNRHAPQKGTCKVQNIK